MYFVITGLPEDPALEITFLTHSRHQNKQQLYYKASYTFAYPKVCLSTILAVSTLRRMVVTLLNSCKVIKDLSISIII